MPPTGAKGLNLAMSDVAVLAEAFIEAIIDRISRSNRHSNIEKELRILGKMRIELHRGAIHFYCSRVVLDGAVSSSEHPVAIGLLLNLFLVLHAQLGSGCDLPPSTGFSRAWLLFGRFLLDEDEPVFFELLLSDDSELSKSRYRISIPAACVGDELRLSIDQLGFLLEREQAIGAYERRAS